MYILVICVQKKDDIPINEPGEAENGGNENGDANTDANGHANGDANGGGDGDGEKDDSNKDAKDNSDKGQSSSDDDLTLSDSENEVVVEDKESPSDRRQQFRKLSPDAYCVFPLDNEDMSDNHTLTSPSPVVLVCLSSCAVHKLPS